MGITFHPKPLTSGSAAEPTPAAEETSTPKGDFKLAPAPADDSVPWPDDVPPMTGTSTDVVPDAVAAAKAAKAYGKVGAKAKEPKAEKAPPKPKKLSKKAQAEADAAAAAAQADNASNDEAQADYEAEQAALAVTGGTGGGGTFKSAIHEPAPADQEVELESTIAVEKHTGTAVVEIQHPTGVTENIKEQVGTVLSSTPMANVGYTVGVTKNLGNYNNVKYSVSVHFPSAPDEASLDKTFEFITKWAETKMEAIGAELEGES